MKKLIILFLMLITTLTGCLRQESFDPVFDVLQTITLRTQTETDFELEVVKQNVELNWTSNNNAITIDENMARVTRQEEDTVVTLTVNAIKGEYEGSASFEVTVLKKLTNEEFELTPITIQEALEEEDETVIKLEGVTVSDSYSMGTHFTDGENTIYAYGLSDLEIGKTYDVVATKTTYGSGSNAVSQITSATAEAVDKESSTLTPIVSTIENVQNTTNYSYYQVTAEIKIDGSTVLLVDNDNKIEVSSYNESTTLSLLKELDGVTITLNVYITGGHNNRTVLTYVQENDLNISDLDKVIAVANKLIVTSSTMSNLSLQTTSLYNTTITWISSDNDVLSNSGIVNRQEIDIDVTLTATITLNNDEVTKNFVVTVININHIVSKELFISEYYEGPTGYNKYIEIYNPNDYEIDLSGYTLMRGTNGAVFSSSYSFTGTLGANSTFVVAHSSADDDIKQLITNLGNNGVLNSVCNFNGDDAIGLFKDGTLIDIFGVEGTDPGDYWTLESGNTKDHRIIRKPGYGANTTWDITEWTSTAISSAGQHLDDFGKHTFDIGE